MDHNGHLNSELAQQISSHDLISLDVFDTLLLRAVPKPVDVFALVKLSLLESQTALLSPEVIDSFPALRVRAERTARNVKEKEHGTREVTLDEIYEQVGTLSGADETCLAVLKDKELELELRLAYANPAARRIWDAAVSQHKKIVLCSDMYLPATFIRRLLQKCGYDGYDALYVSCEHARSKHEGTFLPHIADCYGISAERILHIGDNEHADCTMARQAGCTAFHLPKLPEIPDPVMATPGEPAFYSRTVHSIIQGVLTKAAVTGTAPRDPWEAIGHDVFGPLFTGFLQWLSAAARRTNPEKILLFARDTDFITRHLPRFLAPLGVASELHYVYVSRGSLLLPSLTDFPLTRLWHLFSGKSPVTVRDHLRRMGLTPDVLIGAVQSVGFQSLDDMVPNGEPRMHALLTKLFQPLLAEATGRRDLVKRYLQQFLGDARRLMLVDVGWVGNMQASFLRLLEPWASDYQVRGYYVGLYGYARENDYHGHSMEGWLTHYGAPAGLEKDVWWAGGTELLEFAMCAQHGTTLGYRQNENGVVEPVLESSEADSVVQANSALIQKGAERFLEEYLALYGDFPPSALTSRVWANEFFRLVTAPTRAEADLLGELTHCDAAGNTKRRLPLAPQVSTNAPEELAVALERSFWKAGFRIRNEMAT